MNTAAGRMAFIQLEQELGSCCAELCKRQVSVAQQWFPRTNQSLGSHFDISATWQRSAVYVTPVSSDLYHKPM